MFYFPVTILAGEGCRRQLGAHLRRRAWRRPMIVTDPVIAAEAHDSFLNHVNPRPACRAEIEGILKQIL